MQDSDIETMRRDAEAPVEAGPADLDAVADDLSAAFSNDVMFDWFLRADDKRAAARQRFFRYLVRKVAFGVGKIERPASGGAAAVWMPFEFVGPMPLIQELQLVPMLLNATGLARFGRLASMREDMDKHHPTERPHAYLWFLGVTPQAQGHGVGSRLLQHAARRLDSRSEPAYLETQTERNIALYRRHGFEVISEHRCRPDAPMMWSMWRDPQAAN